MQLCFAGVLFYTYKYHTQRDMNIKIINNPVAAYAEKQKAHKILFVKLQRQKPFTQHKLRYD
jgi:hypothetical protein